MDFLLSLLVGVVFVGLISLIVFRAIRMKKLPENNYTPFDDITEGRVDSDENKL